MMYTMLKVDTTILKKMGCKNHRSKIAGSHGVPLDNAPPWTLCSTITSLQHPKRELSINRLTMTDFVEAHIKLYAKKYFKIVFISQAVYLFFGGYTNNRSIDLEEDMKRSTSANWGHPSPSTMTVCFFENVWKGATNGYIASHYSGKHSESGCGSLLMQSIM